MFTTRPALLTLALAVSLSAACRSRSAEVPAGGSGEVATGAVGVDGSGVAARGDETGGDGGNVARAEVPADGSAAIPLPTSATTDAEAVAALRPDDVRRAIPASATEVALVDLRAARAVLSGFLAGSRDGDPARLDLAIATRLADALGDPTLLTRLQPAQAAGLGIATLDGGALLLVADAGLLRDAPADGGAPVAIGSGANVAVVRDGVVRIGARDAVARSMDEATLDPASMGAVWTALPTDAIFTLFVPDTARVSERVRNGITPIARAQATSLAFALDDAGGMTLTLRSGDREAASRMFGSAQVFLSQSLGALQQRAAPELQGGIGYLSLVSRALWSRISLTTERDTTVVRLAAPDCGGTLANLPTALALGATLAASARNPDRLELPFAPMTAQTTRCDARPPTYPDLPEGHVRIATQGSRNLVALFDVSGALRQLLPTAGGLLPVRLDDRAVQDAVGDRFLGLRGIHDAEGSGAFAIDLGRADSAMLVLPTGSAALGGNNAQLSNLRLTQGGHVGALFGAPGENTLARSRAEPSDERLAAADALPDDVWFALVADADALLGGVGADDGNVLVQSVRGSGAVAFGIGVEGLVFVVPQAAGDAEAIREALPAFATAIVRRIAQRGGSGDAGPQAAQIAAALDGVRIDVRDGAAYITWGTGTGWSRGRLLGVLLGPAVGGALPVSGLNLDDVRTRLMQNVQSNPYIRTPRPATPPTTQE